MFLVRVLPGQGIGFVRYRLRTAAEFAKVAMGDQALDNEETINVRWALVDPNPIAQAVEAQAASARFIQAASKKIANVFYLFLISRCLHKKNWQRKLQDNLSI